MKRFGNLYEKIISVENLRLADEKARRGKTHTYGVRVHDRHREANIQALHEALRTKTFKTSTYDVFTVYEPKERVIYRLPYYPDRIVHHAIMNVIEPIFVNTFTHNTYSCVKGRGIEGCAIDYVGYRFYRHQKLVRKGIKKNLCRTVSRLRRQSPELPEREFKQAVAPWLGWAKHSDSRHLLQTIIPSKYEGIL